MTRARDLANVAGGLPRSNLIINGAMQVAQRGDVTQVTDGYGGPDRFKFTRTGNCHVTLSQDTTVPSGYGFNKSLKVRVTQTPQGVQATDTAQVFQTIEAQNLDSAKKGTSSAEKLTLSFWVRSRNAGTYIAELYDHVNSRHINKAYTISTTNTWQRQVITFEGDTTGALVAGSAAGIQVGWWLLGGNDFQSGTLQTSWGAATSANRAVGQTNAVNSTLNTFFLTGVQLEVGGTDTPFEHEDIGTTIRKCHRYYYQLGGTNAYESIMVGSWYGSTALAGTFDYPVDMRAAPSVSFNGNFQFLGGGGTVGNSISGGGQTNTRNIQLTVSGGSGGTGGKTGVLRANNDTSARVKFDAEL